MSSLGMKNFLKGVYFLCFSKQSMLTIILPFRVTGDNYYDVIIKNNTLFADPGAICPGIKGTQIMPFCWGEGWFLHKLSSWASFCVAVHCYPLLISPGMPTHNPYLLGIAAVARSVVLSFWQHVDIWKFKNVFMPVSHFQSSDFISLRHGLSIGTI